MIKPWAAELSSRCWTAVAVCVRTGSFHHSHDSKPQRNGEHADNSGHPVAGQLLAGQYFEECDVE